MRALVFILSFAVSMLGTPAVSSACEFVRGNVFKLLEEWSKTCNHPLCGKVYIAEASRLKPAAENCESKGWMSMREDIRTTVVAGGAVLFGEVHDNPLHHDLRSRLGLSSYASIVNEQLRGDKAAAIEAYRKENGRNYHEGDLDKFKAAVDWQNGGWQTYSYDTLLMAELKAQVPIYAGDVAKDVMKSAAERGASAVGEAGLKTLALDTPLGDKLDAAMLDELYQGHCEMMPRAELANMAFAQRLRDATLADAVLSAIKNSQSTILLAGNEHVRKDRGVPWYIAKRDPKVATLSIMQIEVEDGKTDADAYVPKDPDGRPAVDYVIFTPRAERKDPCAEFKAKKAG